MFKTKTKKQRDISITINEELIGSFGKMIGLLNHAELSSAYSQMVNQASRAFKTCEPCDVTYFLETVSKVNASLTEMVRERVKKIEEGSNGGKNPSEIEKEEGESKKSPIEVVGFKKSITPS